MLLLTCSCKPLVRFNVAAKVSSSFACSAASCAMDESMEVLHASKRAWTVSGSASENSSIPEIRAGTATVVAVDDPLDNPKRDMKVLLAFTNVFQSAILCLQYLCYCA